MRKRFHRICAAGVAAVLALMLSGQADPEFRDASNAPVYIRDAENRVAIDNICAWPSLELLPDGVIAAAVFNRPSHGFTEGDVDCYISRDGGRKWEFAGTPAPHDSATIRMNHAFGVAGDGSLVVLCSGWGGRDYREYTLPVLVCRSSDGGKTWDRSGSVRLPPNAPDLIPYGSICRVNGGALAACLYDGTSSSRYNRAYVFFSEDDGKTWKDPVLLGEKGVFLNPAAGNFNETALLSTGRNRFVAVARTFTRSPELALLTSGDRGRTWEIPEYMSGAGLTVPDEHPGHLLKLRDGRILLTYGIRRGIHGIGAKVSADGGLTWSRPMVVVEYGGEDGGYPSSVQLEDGVIVTAYYSGKNRNHSRYHMGTVRWKIPSRLPE